jgi:lipopolysaccharide transport system ATP-binding protein
MAATVIRVENLSKQYRLGEIGTGALSHDLKRWWYQLRGKPDPFAKIGEVNDRTTKASSDYVWALQDINFEVKQGEVLGIIGKNGAGKSTLLKILSKTTTPTTGSVKIKGRIASLLEVGTGFHPELSGRENIFLNGAILGMSKREIKAKFDEIVDFSGVERYIDTPVKRYSSGMYVRLAFAVAAHLEPEILIVDEVLAVGDAEFQKKCLGKMKDVSVSEGRTVLFVSHNLQAISTIVSKSLLLNKGKLALIGNTDEVINSYLSEGKISGGVFDLRESYNNKTQIIFAQVVTSKPNQLHVWGNEFVFEVELYLDEPLKKGAFAFQILNEYEQAIVHCWIFDNDIETFRSSGVRKLRCIIPKFRLYMGAYKFRLILAEDSGKTIIQVLENVCYFNVEMLSLQRDYEWHHGACTYLEDNYWETY